MGRERSLKKLLDDENLFNLDDGDEKNYNIAE